MRAAFATPDLPYFYVEMDACSGGLDGNPYGAHDGGLDGNFPTQRQAQRAATLLKNVDFASAIDLGGNQGNVHSPRKQEVGRRMSLKVLSMVYGMSAKPSATGPVLKSIGPVSVRQADNGDSSIAVTLAFDPATATKLHSHGTADCSSLNGSSQLCCDQSPFQVPNLACRSYLYRGPN